MGAVQSSGWGFTASPAPDFVASRAVNLVHLASSLRALSDRARCPRRRPSSLAMPETQPDLFTVICESDLFRVKKICRMAHFIIDAIYWCIHLFGERAANFNFIYFMKS